MLQRDNESSDDEVNEILAPVVEKKKRPPKTVKQLEALAKGRQKMIENKSFRDEVKKQNVEVIENVKSKLKSKDKRETMIQTITETKVPEPKTVETKKKEPRIVVEEEEPEVIIVRKTRKRIVVERSDTEDDEPEVVVRKPAPRKTVKEMVNQYQAPAPIQQRPPIKINFC